jgi:uncharacterized RDD family membrane protein YckC
MAPPETRVALDNTVEVETPEHVHFRYRVAGPVRRLLAYAIDLLVRIAVLLVIGLILLFAMGATKALLGVLAIILFVLEWGYYVFCETVGGGSSVGKRALSLRVVKEGGYPIGVIDSVLRNLLRGADILPMFYVLGLFAMAATASPARWSSSRSAAASPRRWRSCRSPPRPRWRDSRSARRCRPGSARRWSCTSGASI